MTFQNPAALFWFLPLAGIVVLLYLLKMRRRDVRVPATFLWPARTDEVRANALFQRLKPSWLLFLQLLALGLAVIALARPQTSQRGLAGEVTVIVLDASASMSATDVKPSRFEEARRLAREAIQGAGATDRIALIEAGPTPKVVFSLGNDPARQLRALDTVEATDAEAEVGEALRLASALVGSVDGARIVLLSDGVFEPVRDFSRGRAALVYKAIGELGDNLAISALGTAETAQGRQLFSGVRNSGTTAMEGTLSLYADGKVLDSIRTGAIAPGSQWGKTFPAPADTKVFEAKLEASDVLKSDNYAVAVATAGATLRVLLVTKGNPFLERALALDPRVTLDRATEVPEEERGPTGGGKYDVVVFDEIPEIPVRARGILTLGAAGEPTPVKTAGETKAPKFVSAEPVAMMKGVDLRNVFIDKQARVTATGVGEVFAETSAGPVLVAASTPARRQLYLAFAPLQSDFPLQVGFPIFVANALDYLVGTQTADDLAVRAGVPFSVASTETARLKNPKGATTELKPTGSTVVVREARKVGRHELELGSKKKAVYAYLRSDRESDVAPERNLTLGGGEVKATANPARFADFWRPLGLLALLVLAGEWWLFARRS
ncbi:MAG: vWA domain-containing protein [Fimbriimonas sp.]